MAFHHVAAVRSIFIFHWLYSCCDQMHCRHIDGDKHIELHDPIAVGFCADSKDASLSMAFTNVWMMLNYFRVLNSGWPMQLMGDGTFNFADRDIAMLCMGVMTPGGKLRPLIFSYVPT